MELVNLVQSQFAGTVLAYASSYSALEIIGWNFIYYWQSLLQRRMYNFTQALSPFCKVLIIRGVGYKTFVIENTLYAVAASKEFTQVRYLVVRVGHSYNLYLAIPQQIGVKITKKDRKVVVYGQSKGLVSLFSKSIYLLRSPSVYTGRGIHYKKCFIRRKLGKKDVRKGRFF